jgi:hypothetical protein
LIAANGRLPSDHHAANHPIAGSLPPCSRPSRTSLSNVPTSAKVERGAAAHEMGGGASRVERDRVIGVSHRAFAIVDNGPEIGTVRKGLREAWIDFNCAIQILLGFIQLTLLREDQAALGEGCGFGRGVRSSAEQPLLILRRDRCYAYRGKQDRKYTGKV